MKNKSFKYCNSEIDETEKGFVNSNFPPLGGLRGAWSKLTMPELERKSVEEFKTAEKHTIRIVLENIRSAYNVGSAFRTADAFLIDKIYLIGYTACPPHKEIKKTALGAEESVDWQHFKTAAEAIEQLKKDDYKVYAIEQVAGSKMLNELNILPDEKIAFIFGNEVTGVEQATINSCDGCIEIPQWGIKHSINIATAVGVVLWEAVRTIKNEKSCLSADRENEQ